MGEVIVITSGKGGVGKTTTTVNLGCALSQSGKSVILLDADIGLRNLDVVMGLEDKVVYDFVDVIEGRCRLRQAVIKDKKHENLFMMPASQTRDKCDVSEGQMRKLCFELAENFDYVLIDCPAGIEQGFKNAVASSDKAIVVATPELSSIRDADRVLTKLEDEGIEKIKLVINKVRPAMIRKGQAPGVDEMIEILATDLLGVVPEDTEIIIAANKGAIVAAENKGAASAAYKNIAKRLMGETVPLMDLEDDGSFWYRIRKMFRRKKQGGCFTAAEKQ